MSNLMLSVGSLAERIVKPEFLDELPSTDPRAIHSRRDIRRLNWCMGSAFLLDRGLRSLSIERPQRIVELGAGDGSLLLKLAAGLARRWTDIEVVLVDRQPVVERPTVEGFQRLGWKVRIESADVHEWLNGPPDGKSEIFVANLFLHHFDNPSLAPLLHLIAKRAGAMVACEPRRARFPLFMTRLLWAIGCNDVTRHDAFVSVQGGFSGQELSRLWPASGWRVTERSAGGFSHLFVAERS